MEIRRFLRWKQWLGIPAVGFSLTLVLSICQVKPLIMDAEEGDFGFPFTWLVANRGGLMKLTPWSYTIQWFNLIGDLVFYSFIITAFLYLIRNFLVRAPHKQNQM